MKNIFSSLIISFLVSSNLAAQDLNYPGLKGKAGDNLIFTTQQNTPLAETNYYEFYFGSIKTSVSSVNPTTGAVSVLIPKGAENEELKIFKNGQFFTRSFNHFYYSYLIQNITANTFATKVDISLGFTPTGIARGDFDQDGKLDLAISSGSDTAVYIFKNTTSNANFNQTSFTKVAKLKAGLSPSAIAIADIDNDTKLDILVVNQGNNSFSVIKNNFIDGNLNSSSFASKVDFATGTSPRSIAVGYLESNDLKLDVVVANYNSKSVSIFRGTQTTGIINSNSFTKKIDYTVGNQPNSVAIGNLFGPCVVVANLNDNTVSVLKNANTLVNDTSFKTTMYATGSQPYAVNIANNFLNTSANSNTTRYHNIFVANQSAATFSFVESNSYNNLSFLSKKDFVTGTLPRAITNCDVNGDAFTDIITANYSSNSLSIFQNNNSASVPFLQKVDFSVGKQPIGIVSGDFNFDGTFDLIAINAGDQSISILKNNALGSVNINNENVSTGLNANLNKESISKYIILNTSGLLNDTLSITSNNSQLVFSKDLNKSFSNSFSYVPNNDSLTSDTIWVKLNAGSTSKIETAQINFNSKKSASISLKVPITYGVPIIENISPSAAYVGDTIQIKGMQFGKDITKISFNFGSVYASPFFASDSLLKVIVPKSAKTKKITININGYKTLSPTVFYTLFTDTGKFDRNSFSKPLNLSVGAYITNCISDDMNNDGKPEILVSNFTKGVSLFENKAVINTIDTNTFYKPFTFSGVASAFIATDDIDNNGFKDIIFTNYDQSKYSIVQNIAKTNDLLAANSFSPRYDFNVNNMPGSLVVKDINLDGKTDIVSLFNGDASKSFNKFSVSSTKSYTSTSLSDANFENPFSVFGNNNAQLIAIEDLNNNSKPDFVIVYPASKAISIIENQQIGSLSMNNWGKPITITSTVNPSAIEIFDINNDGKNDLIVTDADLNKVFVYQNNTDGSSLKTAQFSAPISIAVGNTPTALKIADIDGDGLADIVVTNYIDNTVTVLKNTGNQSIISTSMFAAPFSFKTGAAPNDIDIVDLDGDGRVEIIVANSADLTVSILKGKRGIIDGLENEFPKINFYIIPNPAQTQFRVEIEHFSKDIQYEIMDLVGNIITKGKLEFDNNVVQIQTLTNGLYIVKIQTDKGIGFKKLIKN